MTAAVVPSVMAQRVTQQRATQTKQTGRDGARSGGHEHRTAKIVELVSTSKKSFEDAMTNGIRDAAESTRGITGAHVMNMSVSCENGKIVEYKVNMKIAFGVERT
jgi:dodecin